MDGHPTPLIVSVTNEELKALLAVDHGALDNILKNKIHPTFLQQKKHTCIACKTQPALMMINTVAFHPQAPEGPAIVDSTPFAVCDSTFCIHHATRTAHSHRNKLSAADPSLFWLVIHYNRKKLRMISKQALPDGISPSEVGSNEVVLASVEDAEKVKFGFEYFESVKNTQVKIVINYPNNSASTNASTHDNNNNYDLLQGIEVPNELGLDDIDRIGEVLERALPDASTVVTNKVDTSLPPDVIEECTESLSQYKQQQPPVSHVQYPTQAKEIDNDTYTRSTASTLTVDSSMPCLDTTGDTNLSRRQQAARDTMNKYNISLDRDAKIPGRRNNNCIVCFKNRGSFTFQGRRHIQINKAEKGATLRWYCPLADPPEKYYELFQRRDELKRQWNKNEIEKRKAKRQKRSQT